MYQKGDRVVYSQTGVCEVADVAPLSFSGVDGGLYYTLKPLFCEATVFVPVNTQKPIRPVISASEANALIDSIPSVRVSGPDSMDVKAWTEQYRALSGTSDCSDLLELVLLIYAKKQTAEENRRSLGQTDQNYMKNAEALLHGELSAALGIDRDEVPDYIRRRISRAGRGREAVH